MSDADIFLIKKYSEFSGFTIKTIEVKKKKL